MSEIPDAPRRARPLYFGDAATPLYGVYHGSAGDDGSGGAAVVLCPPAPQQYMGTHWALRRLATLLAESGIPVLRFDYHGTGDSAGETDAGTLARWEEDVVQARHALQALAGAARTSLVGYGLGAVLAWRASRRDGAERPRDLVLWDPIVRGDRHLDELARREAAYAVRLLHFPDYGSPPRELGGHPFPEPQRVATAAVDLLDEPLPSATRVHLFTSVASPDVTALARRLEEGTRRFGHVHVPDAGEWRTGGQLLSGSMVRTIAQTLRRDAA